MSFLAVAPGPAEGAGSGARSTGRCSWDPLIKALHSEGTVRGHPRVPGACGHGDSEGGVCARARTARPSALRALRIRPLHWPWDSSRVDECGALKPRASLAGGVGLPSGKTQGEDQASFLRRGAFPS